MLKSILFIMTVLLSIDAGFAANTCKGFAFYDGEGQGPEPTEINCAGKNQNSKQCMKSCIAVAKKKCPKGIKDFHGTYNFTSDTTGMEADSFQGKCKK